MIQHTEYYNMGSPIIRQIRDIQVQAERLISNQASLDQIEEFAQYNNEIKSFLIKHVDDDFIMKYLIEIPDLNLDDLSPTGGEGLGVLSIILSPLLGTYFREKQKNQAALDIIRDIRGKYASIELMCRDYFNE
ncbi:MAG: hypothetical protein CMB80_15965 [Flammeovirgaceae bacterium]|nr:hypothetical protein [Flammeovirgaceae bacterium]MBE61275.1 hypothetical protein [Flammeovirgaceae bacterium]